MTDLDVSQDAKLKPNSSATSKSHDCFYDRFRCIAGCEVEAYGYTPNDYISCLKCKRDDGQTEFASLVISSCPSKELANRNGVLVCAALANARAPASTTVQVSQLTAAAQPPSDQPTAAASAAASSSTATVSTTLAAAAATAAAAADPTAVDPPAASPDAASIPGEPAPRASADEPARRKLHGGVWRSKE